jgi:hypothetical protein
MWLVTAILLLGSSGGHFKVNYQDSAGKWRRKWLDGPMRLGDAVKAREDLSVSIRRREVVVNGKALRWPEAVAGFQQLRKVRRPEEQDNILRASTSIRSGIAPSARTSRRTWSSSF